MVLPGEGGDGDARPLGHSRRSTRVSGQDRLRLREPATLCRDRKPLCRRVWLVEVVNVNAAPDVKEAAWKFIDFMAQPDNARAWNLATYTIPSLKALQDDPAILEAAPVLKAAFNVLPYGRWVGQVHNRDRFWQAIHDNFTAVGLGQIDAATGL